MRHVLMYLRCIGIHQVQMYLRCIGVCYHGKLLKQSFRKSCEFVIFRGHLRTRPISPTQNNFSWLTNIFDWKNFEKNKVFPKVNRFRDIGCSPVLILLSGFHSSHLRFRCNGNAYMISRTQKWHVTYVSWDADPVWKKETFSFSPPFSRYWLHDGTSSTRWFFFFVP